MATITAELGDNFQVSISNGTHRWLADEPRPDGGDDTGPNPYDLLLGALAACTVITLSAYARRKGIDLRSVSAEYSHDRIYTDDCADCDERHGGAMVDRITSRVFVDGTFDDATGARLQEIAARCPVHRTLANGVVFDDTAFVG